MRILHFINSLSGGGAEVFVTDLLLSLNKNPQTEKVALLIYAGILDDRGYSLQKILEENGIEIFNLGFKRNRSKIFIPFRIQKILKIFKPNVVHSHLDQADLFLGLAGFLQLNRGNTIYARTLHNNNLITRIPLKIHKYLFSFFDINVGCSNSVKEGFQIKKFRENIIAIPNGVDLSRIIYENDNPHLNHDSKVLKLCVIGSFNKRHGKLQKGQDLLIESLKEDNLEIMVSFLGEGEEKNDLEKECIKSGLKKCVFYGMVKNVKGFIKDSDFVVFPSRFEGLPIAAIETVVNGKPLITSNISAFDAFEKNSTIFFRSEDVQDLKSALCLAIEKKNQYKSQAIENNQLYRSRFNIEETSAKYLALYFSKLSS